MNFAISFLQLILVLALEILIVFNPLGVLVVSILDVTRSATFVVGPGSALEVLIIVFHIDISLRVSISVPLEVRIHFANNIVFIVHPHMVRVLVPPLLRRFVGLVPELRGVSPVVTYEGSLFFVEDLFVELVINGKNFKVVFSNLIAQVLHN